MPRVYPESALFARWYEQCRRCKVMTCFARKGCDTRLVPICQRCDYDFELMASGAPPHGVDAVPEGIEPLSMWKFGFVNPKVILSDDDRRRTSERLLLRLDDRFTRSQY